MRELIRLTRLFLPYRRWMLAGLALSVVTVLANFALLSLSGWFLAASALAGLAGYAAQNAFNFFTPAACVRFFATVRVAARYAERLVTHEATFRLLTELRVWFYTRLEPLAPAALQNQRAADLLSRMVGDIDTLNLFYLRVLTPLLTAAICAAIMVFFTGFFSLPAAVALALGLAAAGLATPGVTAFAGRAPGAAITHETASLRALYVDAAQGLDELLVLGAAPRLLEAAASGNARLINAQTRMSRLSGLGLAATSLATNFAVLAVTLLAGSKIAAGLLGPADLPMLTLGSMAAFEAVAPLPQALQYLGQIRAAAARIFALADQEPAIAAPPISAPAPENFDLALQNISLRYAPEAPWALRHLSLTIPQGRRVGLIGPSGAGKSTLINLLLRFNEYQEGHAWFGGQDLRAYDPATLARHITIISQRSHLFHTTIRDNLLLADGRADDAALWHALEVAQLAGFVRTLPAGLDTPVGEAGAKLSGGQARRVTLARAVLRPTQWLMLDEPTEGLDAGTEQDFWSDLAPLLEGRTVLFITHRRAGLELMQEVHSLRAGQISELDMNRL